MRGFLKVLGSGAMLGATVSAPAQSQVQMPCAPRDVIVERLKSGYGEGPAGIGLQSTGHLFEVWAAPTTGTWTIVMSLANGSTCIVATGTDWQQLDPAEVAMGVPG